jgi:hypothetical protein
MSLQAYTSKVVLSFHGMRGHGKATLCALEDYTQTCTVAWARIRKQLRHKAARTGCKPHLGTKCAAPGASGAKAHIIVVLYREKVADLTATPDSCSEQQLQGQIVRLWHNSSRP